LFSREKGKRKRMKRTRRDGGSSDRVALGVYEKRGGSAVE
jgi:hypothetical protein